MKANKQNETHTFFSKGQSDKMNKDREQRQAVTDKKNKSKKRMSRWGSNIKVLIKGIAIMWVLTIFVEGMEERTEVRANNSTNQSSTNQSILHSMINGKTETRTETQIAKDEITKFSRWERRAAVKCNNWRGVTITTAKDNVQRTKDCRDFEQKREWRRQAEWNMPE